MNDELLSFLDGPWRLSMGLHRLRLEDWLHVDGAHHGQMRWRDRLLAERRDEVVAALPGSEKGCRETLWLVAAHLLERFPERWRQDGRVMLDLIEGRQVDLEGDAPLVVAGRLVQEDLCLMQKGAGGYVLSAAVLCFPSHWRLHDKLGLPMAGIHGPVPAFQAQLGAAADRFMATLAPDRPVWRANWTIAETDQLFLPGHRAQRTFPSGEAVGAGLYLRIERQTLRRLPESGDVLFTIHTSVRPLQEAIVRPAQARALAARIREMPEGMSRYKGFHLMGVPLLGWLDRLGADPG